MLIARGDDDRLDGGDGDDLLYAFPGDNIVIEPGSGSDIIVFPE